MMASPLDLPIGFRFVPRNEELIRILRQRQQNVVSNHPIHHVNVYDSNPQHLSERFEKGNDKDEWFFMTERIKVCKGGKNQKRGNNEGYWDARTAAERIDAGNGLIGYMRQLVYMAGKKPNWVKTDWRMNEYWFKSCIGNDDKVDYALCKIFVTPMATKKKSKKDNHTVENEEHLAMVVHDPEYQAPDQIMPQCDQAPDQIMRQFDQAPDLMMMPEGEQQQQLQVTWSPPQDPKGQDTGLGRVLGHIVVDFGPNPPVFVEEVEQPLYVEYQEPHIVPQNLMMVQEGEQLQEQQKVTQSPLLPPQGQDPELWMDTVAQTSNINVPDDDDFWNMTEDEWWNSSDDEFLNI